MIESFIGLTDLKVEGKFEWDINHYSHYTNWCNGEPNDRYGSEDAVFIRTISGCWNDVSISYYANFICEIP